MLQRWKDWKQTGASSTLSFCADFRSFQGGASSNGKEMKNIQKLFPAGNNDMVWGLYLAGGLQAQKPGVYRERADEKRRNFCKRTSSSSNPA